MKGYLIVTLALAAGQLNSAAIADKDLNGPATPGAPTAITTPAPGNTPAAPPPAIPTATNGPLIVDDSNSGWTWSGMVEVDDPGMAGGTGHAGMVGSYGVCTFHGTHVIAYAMGGPAVVVGGRRHKTGKMRVSIDGVEKATVDLDRPEPAYGIVLCDVSGLADANHVLQVDPLGGWATIDDIKLIPDVTKSDAPDTPGDPPNSGRVVLFDPVDNFDLISDKSPGWHIDNINTAILGGDPSRLSRANDDRQYLAYNYNGVTGFMVRVFSQSGVDTLRRAVKFFASTDSGLTTVPVDYTIAGSFPGGTQGSWVGYDLVPVKSLPAHTNKFYVTFSPASGLTYDPELSQVSIYGKK